MNEIRTNDIYLTMTAIALTIAGSDSGAGAGIQADLKSLAALGVYGTSVITALTAQNTKGVLGVEAVTPEFVGRQMAAIFADFDLSAIKIGMLHNGAIIEVVAEMLRQGPKVPVILDPVMISSSGRALLDPDAIGILKKELLPLVTLLTPNLPELAVLLDMSEPTHSNQILDQEEAILGLGPEYVLVKGGHGEGEELTDLLFGGEQVRTYQAKRIESRNLHGTGCTLSAAIAAQLAKGHSMAEAVAEAHDYLQGAIVGARNWRIGAGQGPLDHFHPLKEKITRQAQDD